MIELEQTEELLNGHQDWVVELSETLQKVILPGKSEQCIYTVPPEILQVNPKAFTPEVVCIGPLHRPHGSDDNILWKMEELKLKYLKGFQDRTRLNIEDLALKLKEWENKIRSSYGMTLSFESNDLIKIFLVDACFIIEHFLRFFSFRDWEENDPLLLKDRVIDRVHRDLLRLENQLPFFVLDNIYNFTGMIMVCPSFLRVTFYYFGQYNRQNIEPEERVCHPKHFTDLLRTFMVPISFNSGKLAEDHEKCVYNVSQLSEAGLVFKVSEDKHKSLLDFELKDGVFTMPFFPVHDATEAHFRNILAFEECHFPPEAHYISQYFFILDFLINNEKDVDILVDKKIIVNWMGNANDVVKLVKNLCKNVSTPIFCEKYFNVCRGLNGFYKNPWNKYKAIFMHECLFFIREYFNTPWKIASTSAAVLLLLFTLIQTICSVIQVVQGSK